MAKLSEVFNASEVPERTEFEPVPPGQYSTMIVASEIKQTKKGGEMIVLELEIQDGEHSGRKLFERLNIKNDNQKAVDMAFRTLAEIVKAVGKTTIKDTEELHGKKLFVDVRVEPPKSYIGEDGKEQEGKPQNSIKKFLPFTGATSSNGTVSAPKSVKTETVEQKDQSSVPPWKRQKP